jgi:hypothetical protein
MYLTLKDKIQLLGRQLDPPGFAGPGPLQTQKSGPEIILFAARLFK